MIRTDKRMKLCSTLLICNLVFIWGNSLLPGEVSGSFSDWVKGLLSNFFPTGETDESGSFLIRKLAHFTEFAALGALLSWHFGMREKNFRWPLACGVGAACIDETIQIFVPDRGPGIRDVLLDSSGVIAGMLLLFCGHTLSKRKSNNP